MSSPLAANPADSTALADELLRFRVVESSRLAELLAEFPGGGSEVLADFLVARGVLNSFQAKRALAGAARWLNLGPYRLVGETNPGTFGPVYAARHRDRPGEFRLQMFPLRSLWRARQAKQIARALTTAPHPSIVPLADADSANGLHYLVWPHVPGVSLEDLVTANGPRAIPEVIKLLVELASALHACHQLGVAHGTITPQAIVMANGVPMLLEHGAGAILVENLSADESLLDTLSASIATANVLEYAAPEFVTSTGTLTPYADQYALGAVGYFALTGQSPFPTGSSTEQLASKFAGPPSPLAVVNPAVPPALAAVIDRMLRPHAEDRFADMAEMRDWLAVDEGKAKEPLSAPVTVVDFPGQLRPRGKSSVSSIVSESVFPEVAPVSETPGATSTDTDSRLASITPLVPAAHALPREPETLVQSNSPVTPVTPDPPVPPALPTSPHAPASPVREDPVMAKLAPDATSTGSVKKPARASDPRTTVGAPIHYHTETPPDPSSGLRPGIPPSPPQLGEPPATDSHMWRRMKRNLMFWKPTTDVVQASVFGPPSLTPGQSGKVSVYLHAPSASESVHTLCRAFHHDAVLIGAGYLSREIAREESVGVHLAVSNAGVTKSMLTFLWRGQPHRLVFDLHVPWESPGGPAPGVVSVGLNNVRVGAIEFWLQLLPRKG